MPPIDKFRQNTLLDEAEFEEALATTKETYPSFSRHDALAFMKELAIRNRQSRNDGEVGYYQNNLLLTLRQFNLSGEVAIPYRSIAGSYFGQHAAREAATQARRAAEDEAYADAIAKDRVQQVRQDMRFAERERGGDPED